MTPLQRLSALDAQIQALLDPLPRLEEALDQCLVGLLPVAKAHARDLMIDGRSLLDLTGERLASLHVFALPPNCQVSLHDDVLNNVPLAALSTRVEGFCRHLRQQHHGRVADYWAERDAQGTTRRDRLLQLRRRQWLEEIELRLADHTLDSDHAYQLRICLELALPWQRRHLPPERRPQVYRPLLDSTSPNWRAALPGALVIVATGPEGQLLERYAAVGPAILCTFSHGIEAFASLNALHIELCERLDDPVQSEPLLRLCKDGDESQRMRQAERLRYDWLTDDMLDVQVTHLIDAQSTRLAETWLAAWHQGTQRHLQTFDAQLEKAMDLTAVLNSKHALATRYALLLEQHLPSWLKGSSQQRVTHIMQTLQDLATAIEQAAAPGILTLEQFRQRNTLLEWSRARLRERINQVFGLDLDPRAIKVSVTLARQIGPVLNPLMPSGYIPAASRPQVGDTLELVNVTYALDELALLNIAWFDVDYWLTARVHAEDGNAIPALTRSAVRQLVRELNAGASYVSYLQTHLIDSPAGQWRQEAHGRVNRARMRAEAVKARYAGHFLPDPLEQGYRWADVILRFPDSNWRATIEEHRISVRQLVIQGHTVQGVLLLNAEVRSINSFVVYTPDAPDRRAWREYRTTRELLRALRGSTALRQYVTRRMPLADAVAVDTLLRRGRLGPHVTRPSIDGNLFQACYLAEVCALMSLVDSASRTNLELLGKAALDALWLLLDLISLVLPSRALSALSFGRASIAIWGGLEAMQEGDRREALNQAFDALSHTIDGINNFAGSTFMRQAMRGLPKPPSAPIPSQYATMPDGTQLRYRLDGIYGEGVYEKTAAAQGLPQYFIKDSHGHHYQVTFDGQRWRAVDPRQPNAYLKVPVIRRQDGEWVVDSPVLWYDGLPELVSLFADCVLSEPLVGTPTSTAIGLHTTQERLYLQTVGGQLALRAHLLDDHYHLQLPQTSSGVMQAWAVVRWQDAQWQVRVRQIGRSSDWLALPTDYSVSLGNR